MPSLGTRSIPVDAPAALARLKEEGCIYTRKDEFGWKIGLKVKVEILLNREAENIIN